MAGEISGAEGALCTDNVIAKGQAELKLCD